MIRHFYLINHSPQFRVDVVRYGRVDTVVVVAAQVTNMFDDALGVSGNYAYIIDMPPEEQQGRHHVCVPPESLAAMESKAATCSSQYGDTAVGVATKQVQPHLSHTTL
jgi:hypothetical protein